MCAYESRDFGNNAWGAVSKPDDIYGVLDRCELAIARDHARPEPNSGSNCKRVRVGQGKAGLDPRRIDDPGVAVRNDDVCPCSDEFGTLSENGQPPHS